MKPQTAPPNAHSQVGVVRLVWLAIFISVFSFLFYQRQGDVLLYGDAVAHINIARRIFDSKTPGLLQLGTVWLPLPHVLIAPFIVSTRMWQSGAGGSIPSMAAYVFGVLGIFRLARSAMTSGIQGEGTARVLARDAAIWGVAILYGANPNLIYIQATAMGESLYLAWFIWTVVYFSEFALGKVKTSASLIKCGLCLVGGCLTRYDGWFLAALLIVVVMITASRLRALAPKVREREEIRSPVSPSRTMLVRFFLIAVAAPVFWLVYNAAVYRNPLEFGNGPYSAKAIEQKTGTVNPAKGNLWAAGCYFVKAAELNIGEANWQERLWLALALLGSVVSWSHRRGRAPLLLWAPLPFYALSVAYGSVPIFLPTWWPFSNYNLRYGLQLLPALAVFVPVGISFIVQFAVNIQGVDISWRRWADTATLVGVIVLAVVSYGAIWRADPICYREAAINNRARLALDKQVAGWIKSLPADSTLLMYLGEHVGALQQAAIPLRRVINEGNHRVWRQPADPQGLWERALADPAKYADYAVGFEGDPVWKAAADQHLTALVEIHTTGQPRAVVFPAHSQGRR